LTCGAIGVTPGVVLKCMRSVTVPRFRSSADNCGCDSKSDFKLKLASGFDQSMMMSHYRVRVMMQQLAQARALDQKLDVFIVQSS
jgi:hypothetical protein